MNANKTNLFFYNGKIRNPGAIWRGIWNVEGTSQSRIGYAFQSIKCFFGFHDFVEDMNSEPGPFCIYCSHCQKAY